MRASGRTRWASGAVALPLAIGLAGCATSHPAATATMPPRRPAAATPTPHPARTATAGDPAGAILSALRMVTGAVPPPAHLIWTHAAEPEPHICPGGTGTGGYDPVSVQVYFSWHQPQRTTLTSVRHALAGLGWRRAEPSQATFRGQTYQPAHAIGSWVRTLPGGRPATAALFRDPLLPGSDAHAPWAIFAEAPSDLPPPNRC